MAKIFVVSGNNQVSQVEITDLSNENEQISFDDRQNEEENNIVIAGREDAKRNLASSSQTELKRSKNKNHSKENFETEIEQFSTEGLSEGDITVIDNQNILENESLEDLNDVLEPEKISHEDNAMKRYEHMTLILLNKSNDFAWLECFLYTIGITLFGFVLTTPLSCLPLHDIIQYPEYWYETLLTRIWNASVSSVNLSFLCSYFLNLKYIRRWHNIAVVFLLGNLAILFLMIFIYLFWTLILGYQYPMPFMGWPITWFLKWIMITVIWIRLPKQWRKKTELQRRMKFLICYVCLLWQLSPIIINIIIAPIRKFQNELQPIIVFFCLSAEM